MNRYWITENHGTVRLTNNSVIGADPLTASAIIIN